MVDLERAYRACTPKQKSVRKAAAFVKQVYIVESNSSGIKPTTNEGLRSYVHDDATLTKYSKGRNIRSACNALNNGHYKAALRSLVSRSRAAAKAFDDLVRIRIHGQVKAYGKSFTSKFPFKTNKQTMDDFRWDDIIEDMKEAMPTWLIAVQAAMLGAKTKEGLRYL